MRNLNLVEGEYYHIYNRGVESRNIFNDKYDSERFLQSMNEFNSREPIGSIYENSFLENTALLGSRAPKLVEFVAYCLNPNHYHFLLKQLEENGISKFMQRIGTGYTNYFNNRYARSGVLFQGKFKAVHVNSNEYLLHVSAYVNLNDKVHQLGSPASKLIRNSWEEYMTLGKGLCKKEIILEQFRSRKDYEKFAQSSLKDILKRKEESHVKSLLLEKV